MNQTSPFEQRLPQRLMRRANWWVRDRFPHRSVTRHVLGADLEMPWSHRLPDYSAPPSVYGQNLVSLARELASPAGPLTFLDIGANIGDSTMQIAAAVDTEAVCVEADEYFLPYLRRNTAAHPGVHVEPSFLTPGEADEQQLVAVREGGTTRFAHDESARSIATLTPQELRARHPMLEGLRLVKSDTDGYDVVLIPEIARVWHDVGPVLFFEFDPGLTTQAGHRPHDVWPRLAELGYERAAVWSNIGHPLGQAAMDALPALAERIDPPRDGLGYHFWDVACFHRNDEVAAEVLDRLVGGTLS